jgi:hypothetical protein
MRALLTPGEEKEALARYASKTETSAEVAADYDISPVTIRRLAQRRGSEPRYASSTEAQRRGVLSLARTTYKTHEEIGSEVGLSRHAVGRITRGAEEMKREMCAVQSEA